MHPVLGTMMPEICEAPHLPVFPFIYHCAPYLMGGMCSLHFHFSPLLAGYTSNIARNVSGRETLNDERQL